MLLSVSIVRSFIKPVRQIQISSPFSNNILHSDAKGYNFVYANSNDFFHPRVHSQPACLMSSLRVLGLQGFCLATISIWIIRRHDSDLLKISINKFSILAIFASMRFDPWGVQPPSTLRIRPVVINKFLWSSLLQQCVITVPLPGCVVRPSPAGPSLVPHRSATGPGARLSRPVTLRWSANGHPESGLAPHCSAVLIKRQSLHLTWRDTQPLPGGYSTWVLTAALGRRPPGCCRRKVAAPSRVQCRFLD